MNWFSIQVEDGGPQLDQTEDNNNRDGQFINGSYNKQQDGNKQGLYELFIDIPSRGLLQHR